MHLHGLTGLRKAIWKADLAIYIHMLGLPGQCSSAALMLSYKLDLSCYANRDGFCKSNYIFKMIYTHIVYYGT